MKKLKKRQKRLMALGEAHSLDHEALLDRALGMANQIQNLNASNHDVNHTLDLRWILYTSKANPVPSDYVKGTPENCIWIMSNVGEPKNARLPR